MTLVVGKAFRTQVEPNVDKEVAKEIGMRKTAFVIDFLGEHEFEGYTREEEWNGFACPNFTFDQAQRLTEAWRASGNKAEYDRERDEFSFEMRDSETDTFPAIEIDGVQVYRTGAGCWIWSEVQKTSTENPDAAGK